MHRQCDLIVSTKRQQTYRRSLSSSFSSDIKLRPPNMKVSFNCDDDSHSSITNGVPRTLLNHDNYRLTIIHPSQLPTIMNHFFINRTTWIPIQLAYPQPSRDLADESSFHWKLARHKYVDGPRPLDGIKVAVTGARSVLVDLWRWFRLIWVQR